MQKFCLYLFSLLSQSTVYDTVGFNCKPDVPKLLLMSKSSHLSRDEPEQIDMEQSLQVWLSLGLGF